MHPVPILFSATSLVCAAHPQDLHPKLAAFAARQTADAASPFAALRWHAIGPRFCGGRIESIAVHPGRPFTFWVAPGSGNLWKSTDGGLNWLPVFEHEATFAIGDVAVAPSDPDVIWVGTGEAHLGGMSYDGCGVYRSTDGGASWSHAGLAEVDRIGKVRVDPLDPNRAWVAAIGPRDGRRSEARGVFRTDDAGQTWTRTLDAGATVAAIDLVLAPDDPTRLYCATWDRSGGDGSGVHRSTDRGTTWERLGADHGLPVGAQIERVAVDVCRAEPSTVYALTVDESKPGEGRYGVGGVVYRSDDGGDHWTRCHPEFLPTYVGWDFCDIRVAPDDPDQVFVCGMKLLRSRDGGRTWAEVSETVRRLLPFETIDMPTGELLHLDVHDLWIDPTRPDRMLLGNDGGLYQSFDRGGSWLHLNVLPITEFYTCVIDPHDPRRIWGGTQDNAAVVGIAAPIDPHGPDHWRHVFLDRWAGGDGLAVLPDPTDANVTYFEHQNGDMRRKRLDGATLSGKADKSIRPRGRDLQFAWGAPLLVSAHEPHTLYCAAQHVFRSPDRGDSWVKIGDDLGSGRALVALAESPLRQGRLYAGAANGVVQATDDDGASWRTCAGLPNGGLRRIVASRHLPDRVFACVVPRQPRVPVIVTSDDAGATWRSLSNGLPPESVNVLLEDPRDPAVLYVGTDAGVMVTRDGGVTWESLSTTLPTTPVLDLAFQPATTSLFAATHGRGIFTLDVSTVRARE